MDGQEKRDAEQRLNVQREIAEVIERQTAGIESYAKAQKGLFENIKLRNKAEKELLKLRKKIKDAEDGVIQLSEEKLKLLKEEVANQDKQLKKLDAVNKELLSIKNLLRASANELYSQFVPGFSEVYKKANDVDKAIRNVSASLGLSGAQSETFLKNINGASMLSEGLNVSMEDLAKTQQTYGDIVGRNVVLSKDELNNSVLLSKSLNMSVDEMASLSGEMEQFGFGAGQANKIVESVADTARKSGMNAQQMVKKFGKNLSILNRVSFKGGVDGLKKMTVYTEKMKMNLDSVVGSMEKAFNPEGAIEMGAELQMLGGNFAKLGDPFQLMFDARNNPEEFIRKISDSVKGLGEVNEKGEVIMSAYEMQLLEQAGNALGQSKEEMMAIAKQRARIDSMGSKMFGLTDAEKDLVSGLAEMEGGVWKIDGKAISSLDKNMVEKLMDDKKTTEQRARDNQNFTEKLDAIKNQLTGIASQFLLPILEELKPYLDATIKWISGLSETGKKITGALLLFGKFAFDAAKWIANGVFLRKGFDSGGIKGVGKKMLGKGKNLMSKMNPFSKKEVSYADKKDMVKTRQQRGGGLGGRSKPQTSTPGKGGKQSGMFDKISKVDPKKIYSLAVAMLALGGAILLIGTGVYIASKGLTGLVTAFGELSGEQAQAAMLSIVAIMAGFTAMVIALAFASSIAAGPIIAFGAGMLLVGGGIALAAFGISLLVAELGKLDPEKIGLMAPAFMGVAIGVGMLTTSLIGLALAVGPSLIALGALTLAGLLFTQSFKGIDFSSMSIALKEINNISSEKIQQINEMAKNLAQISDTNINIEMSELKVSGEITLSGEGGGKSNMEWVNNPTFVRNLSEKIFKAQNDSNNGSL